MSKTDTCYKHEDRAAESDCERCGKRICVDCEELVLKKTVCLDCTEIDGVHYLLAFRLGLWGKRDAWVWFFGGFGSLVAFSLLIVFGLAAIFGPPIGIATNADRVVLTVFAFFAAVTLAINLNFFFLKAWARNALFVGPVLWAVALLMLQSGVLSPNLIGQVTGRAFMPLAIVTVAYTSARNKLAFKISISQGQLESLYKAHYENRTAPLASLFGIFSLFFPPFAVLSIPMAIVGLSRADPNSWPPIEGRSLALRGLVLSCLSLLFWGAIIVVSSKL